MNFVLAAAAPAPGPDNTFLPMMILMMVIMYFVLIRPQKKRQKELEAKIASLKKGDKVITTGGLHGIIANVKERTVIIKAAENVKLEFEKPAVATIIPKDGGNEEAAPTGVTAEPAPQSA